MNTLLLVFFFLILLMGVRVTVKDLISKFVLYSFVLYWYTSLIASTFSPYGLLEVSTYSYILLILATGSFVAGMVAVSRSKINKSSFDRSNISYVLEKLIDNKWLLPVYAIIIVYYAQYAINAIAVAALQGHAEMIDQLEVVFMGNDNAQQIFGYIVTPILHISLVLISYSIITIKGRFKQRIIPLIIQVVFFVEYLMIAGGRSTIMIAAMYFLFTFITLVPLKAIKRLSLRKVISIIVAVFVVSSVFTYMNLYRTTGTFDMSLKQESEEKSAGGAGETIIRYSLSPIVMFDRSLKYNYVDRFGYQYGKASLMGIDGWVAVALRKIGINHKTSSHITEYLEENYFPYDKQGNTTNYAYTGVFYHYMDFGIIGVILFPFLFGILYRKSIIIFYKQPTFYSFLIIAIGYFMMMHSVFTCYFIKGWVVLYIIILLFLMSRKPNNIKRVTA